MFVKKNEISFPAIWCTPSIDFPVLDIWQAIFGEFLDECKSFYMMMVMLYYEFSWTISKILQKFTRAYEFSV